MTAVGRTSKGLFAIAAALIASLLLVSSAGADARSVAVAAFNATSADARVPAGWTGSTDTCTVGEESAASIGATLNTLNTLRDFAGLGAVAFSAEKNHRALAAATLMKAQGQLSHYPDPSWKCFSDEGAFGARTSNLYLRESGAAAMVGFVNDAGIESLGHRRWILDPKAVEMGTGSTGTSNALVVTENGGDGTRGASLPGDNLVAWPSPGLFPAPWIFEDWSLSIGNGQTQGSVSVANAQVSVKVDGQSAAVSGLQPLGFNPNAVVGTGSFLTWKVALPASVAAGDHDIKVDVTGVTLNGAPLPVSYTVKAFDPAVAGADPGAACAKAKAKLAKAKKKLKKAKAAGKPSKVKAAKQKVKKAKAKKKAACA